MTAPMTELTTERASDRSIERRYLRTPAGLIHVRIAGPTAAPLIVLLHQVASSGAMYEALMARLAPRWRVLAPDLPGFGQSPAPAAAPTVAWYADAIAPLIDPTGGSASRPTGEAGGVPTPFRFASLSDRPAVVFGHHAGASVAAELAAAHPTRVAAVVLSGPPLLDAEGRAALAALPALVPRADGSHLTALWERLAAKDVAASLAVVQRELVLTARAGRSGWLGYQAIAAHDLAACLDAIQAPTLIIAGGRDPLAAAAVAAHARVAGAALVRLADAGTYLCDTHADVLASVLEGHAA